MKISSQALTKLLVWMAIIRRVRYRDRCPCDNVVHIKKYRPEKFSIADHAIKSNKSISCFKFVKSVIQPSELDTNESNDIRKTTAKSLNSDLCPLPNWDWYTYYFNLTTAHMSFLAVGFFMDW